MSFKCGIVGLPNVGKSTLFNALTQTVKAQAENYPFCTIEPNIGKISVPDERIEILAKIAKSKDIIHTQIELVDIAGLVRNASKGEGLGNQFLSHIREVDAIINMTRCFEDKDINHVENIIDPVRDIELIQTELILSDLSSLEKKLTNLEKKSKNNLEAKEEFELVKKIIPILSKGNLASDFDCSNQKEKKYFYNLQLITSKPQLIVGNLKENDAVNGNNFSKSLREFAEKSKMSFLTISAKIEEEIANLESEEEKKEFLSELGMKESGLSKIVKACYKILNLITFFTVGPKETRSWTVTNGSLAPQAAGKIHSDFESGFIKAETISYEDYIKYKGEEGAKNTGKLRIEGKEYIVKDGDTFHFRFNN